MRNYILFILSLCSFFFVSCRPKNVPEPSNEQGKDTVSVVPDDPSVDTVPSLLYGGDFTENVSRVVSSHLPFVQLGIRVGDNLDSLMQILSVSLKDSTKVGFVLEFTDTVSSLDYHYLPACWSSVPAGQVLADTVYQYTKQTLQALSMPIQFVQIGRCISCGLLWHTVDDQLLPSRPMSANEQGWQNQALYLKAAARAVREVCPGAKIVLQTDKIGETESLHRQLNNLITYWSELGIDFDVLSLFYNPLKHHNAVPVLESALAEESFVSLISTHNLSVHLETFYPCSEVPIDAGLLSESKVGYPYTSYGQHQYLQAVRTIAPYMLIYRYCASGDCFQLISDNFLYQ